MTLLAFGNGAPDFFAAIASVGDSKGGEVGLAIGALLGAALFVSSIVAGTISIIKPFKSMERPLLRDIIFFIATGFWLFKIVWLGYITLTDTIGEIYGFLPR